MSTLLSRPQCMGTLLAQRRDHGLPKWHAQLRRVLFEPNRPVGSHTMLCTSAIPGDKPRRGTRSSLLITSHHIVHSGARRATRCVARTVFGPSEYIQSIEHAAIIHRP